ncbi:hypothetical protein OVY01_12305 [Robbsia sp. Bb-Pol-6]|uniref:Rap1a immunity protein domain-containing protein n=1 Tax=Robbsia betulipollinis TaxID=2981849 RepID=A0ABT3ZN94_9BURK|nr:hypothetical protein [Robbsia betulipollinis]MCY0388004.1 hypothetical protein [Robbsia betulipollinis]
MATLPRALLSAFFWLGMASSTLAVAQGADPTGGMTGAQYLQFAQRDPAGAKQLVLMTSRGLIADHRVSHKFVCLPDGVTYVRGPGLLEDYMAHHPAQSNYTLHQLVFISWMTAFPC